MRNHYATSRPSISRRLGFLVVATVATLVGVTPALAQSQGQLFASITDQAGEPVLDLTADSFQVQEDGATMIMVSADPGTTPMKIAMLIDNSEAMAQANGISSLRNALMEFLNVLPPQHEVGMFSIAGSVMQMVDFTDDRDALREAADGVFRGSGGAKMIEGLMETWDRRFEPEDAWPVVFMVLTDGPETSGNMNPDQLNEFIVELVVKGAMVHAVILEASGGGMQSQISEVLTKNTGGLYRSMNSPTALVDTLGEFATKMGDHFDDMTPRYRLLFERPGDTPGAQMGAGVVGTYKMQLFGDRRMPPQ